MKALTHLSLAVAILAACQTCSCKKDKDEDPKPQPTQEGLNTFFCKINGVPYTQRKVNGTDVPFYSVYPEISTVVDRDPMIGEVSIYITYPDKDNTKYLAFRGGGVFSTGSYNLKNDRNFNACFRDKVTCDYCYPGVGLFPNCSGKIAIAKFDPNSRILSGTFEFKTWLGNHDGCDTIRVTDGVFDLLY